MATSGATLLANASWNGTASPPPDCDAANDYSDSCYSSFARFVHVMDLIAVPIIIVVGVIGNVVSCLVFTCTYLRGVSSSVYLAALAIVDTVYLCVLFFSWLVDVGVQVHTAVSSDQYLFSNIRIYLAIFSAMKITLPAILEEDEKHDYLSI